MAMWVRATLVLAAMLAQAGVASAQPLSAVVTHEATEHGADGVTRSTRFQERLYRDDEQVWITRVGVTARRATSDHDLELGTLTRWLRRDRAGVHAALVSPEAKLVVELEPASFETFGISANWEEASALADLRGLTPGTLDRSTGGRWYERRSATSVYRVLWSDALGIALMIEARSVDGRKTTRITVAIQPQAWSSAASVANVASFRHVDRSDLGD
jgi:hypothetical protein